MENEQCEQKMDYKHIQCKQKVKEACATYKPIQVMLHQLNKLGCTINKKNLLCEPCEKKLLGGFDPINKEVFICENNLSSQKKLNSILTHELIHAFDVCRAKYIHSNLDHTACSEIRAANLSEDCSFLNEVFEMNFRLKSHKQTCVKRKATKSLMTAHNIDLYKASAHVEKVFQECYNDHTPFRS
ncbi:mitochondrial inner membrane protease ATP23 homolog isoform X2 [Hydra vulgaris]|uniref:Mitochondrial inner membrane protease ATP23 n=2 Tax=Hydra vulgaris TaxID=6087 RepID=A0ABM4C3B7_HYDVU